ncbi:MAG: hypothetical protein HOV79_09575 [Hamadaea sp.]|nr:hypothetical protein [Hamadaea sp.]
MSDTSVRIALLGLPQTGKTTYLAAFYNALCDPDVAAPIKIVTLPEQATYLMTILRNWQEARPTGRTATGEQGRVEMRLSHEGDQFTLAMPDMSGELFENVLRERVVPAAVYTTLVEHDAYLVFVHPDELRDRILLTDVAAAKASVAAVTGQRSGPPATVGEEFATKALPLQASMVDLLQAMAELRQGAPCRLAVLISAWDRVGGADGPPDRWLAARMPLLSQYLANAAHLDCAVFGVSAQGGVYDDSGAMADVRPSERAYAVSAGAGRIDITAPVCWAAGLAGAAVNPA